MVVLTSNTSHRRLDLGRLIMVPLATLMLIAGAMVLSRPSDAGTLRWIGTALVAVFYAVIIWAYLRRGPANLDEVREAKKRMHTFQFGDVKS